MCILPKRRVIYSTEAAIELELEPWVNMAGHSHGCRFRIKDMSSAESQLHCVNAGRALVQQVAEVSAGRPRISDRERHFRSDLLLHSYRLGKVAGLIYVAAAADGDVVSEQL